MATQNLLFSSDGAPEGVQLEKMHEGRYSNGARYFVTDCSCHDAAYG